MRTRKAAKLEAIENGFAQIVRLVLLVILALGLLSLSTIPLRNSSQWAAAAIARSHAKLALMMVRYRPLNHEPREFLLLFPDPTTSLRVSSLSEFGPYE